MAKTTVPGLYIADSAITAAKLNSTLDLTGKTITVATASSGDNDTTVASTAFVQQEIASLVDSSPSALNTLNELAAAIGDDANFSTTITNSIATKLALAGGTMTGDLIINTTGALQIPVGTTAQRPTAAQGQLRFNTTTSKPEIYNGSAWADVGGGVESVNSATGAVTLDTDDISEGSTNLYFTNARADARIAAATTDDLSEGSTNLYFTTARANSAIDGRLSGSTGVTVSNGAISIGQDVATSTSPTFQNLTLSGTDSIKVPSGTTAQRSGSPANGMLRYNSTNGEFEGYQSGAWGALGGDTTSSVDLYTVTGDGTSDTYDTGKNPQSENNTWVFIGGVYQPKSTYSYSGTQITLSENLPNGEDLEVITGTVSTYNPTDAILGQFNTTTSNTASYDTSLTTENENNVFVFIDGVYQPKSSYTYSGSTLTLDATPTSGMSLEVLVTRSMNAATVTTGFLADDAVTTAKITDANVTAAKLASSLDLTGKTVTVATASAGDNDTSVASTAFVRQEITSLVDSAPAAMDTLNELAAALGDDANFSTTVNASIAAKLPLAGGTLTGNLNFGDDNIAIFGAGSDLQIYHDSTSGDSRIVEGGTGHLALWGNNIKLLNAAGTETMLDANPNAAVTLYYDNVAKLATTSTGIDVTGNITVGNNDTIIAENNIRFKPTGASYIDHNTTGQNINFRLSNSSSLDVTPLVISPTTVTVAGNLSVDNGTIKLDGNYPSGTNNVALGDGAFANGSASNNVAIGHNASASVTTSNFNTVVGSLAFDAQTTGGRNTAIGYSALGSDTTGGRSTAIGWSALSNQNDTSSGLMGNIALGYNTGGAITTGTYNTIIGYEAGTGGSAFTGTENHFIGRISGRYTTTGSYNIGLGNYTLNQLTTASYNIAIGRSALGSQQTGDGNIAIGYNAMTSANGVTGNTMIGYQAGDALTTGNYNVAMGLDALGSTTTASNNVAIGVNAMRVNTTGTGNVAVGRNALEQNTTGGSNTAVGYGALYANTDGTANTAFGYECGENITSGNYNTAVGYQNLNLTTTGTGNVAIGVHAMRATTTGNYNVGIGYTAVENVSSGVHNIGIGMSTLDAVTTNSQNTAVGAFALGNTTISQTTAFGYSALGAHTTGLYNTAVGTFALDAVTTGQYNTAIGYQAGTNATGSGNTFVGLNAGRDQSSASNNTYVGWDAGLRTTTGGSNVVVGRGAALNGTTFDTSVIIGDDAGSSITSAGNNVIIGRSAGDDITTGGQNVIIGKLCDGGGTAVVGRVVLGYSATGATNNSITVGYGSSDSALQFGNTSWYTPSDERLKEDIQDETIGLAFINDLRPRTFRWKKRKDIAEELSWKYKEENPEERVMNGKYNHGFIAQEVKATIDNHNLKDGFGFWMQDNTEGNQQRVGDSELIPILVKAIQELSTQVEELKVKLNKGE